MFVMANLSQRCFILVIAYKFESMTFVYMETLIAGHSQFNKPKCFPMKGGR